MWGKLPQDMLGSSWGIEKFAHLCFSDAKHSQMFTSEYVILNFNGDIV